jgi:hypothetical protein
MQSFEKEYINYTSALEDCSVNGFQNAELCNMIADKTLSYRETLKGKPFNLTPTNVFLLAVINQILVVHPTD